MNTWKIKCCVNLSNEKKIYYFTSDTTIKQLKKKILDSLLFDEEQIKSDQKFSEENSKTSENYSRPTKIYLYYQENELINNEQTIGELNYCAHELNFKAITFSMNETSISKEDEGKEKLITKVSDDCSVHKNQKKLFICITCKTAFCNQCSEKHNNHKVIEKRELMKFGHNLKNIDNELNESLEDLNLIHIYENKKGEICDEEKKICNNSIDKLQNRLDSIKNIYNSLQNNFRRDIDSKLPYVFEYKEKVENLINTTFHLETIKDEKQFLDLYYWYMNITKKNKKIHEDLKKIQLLKQNFKESLDKFNDILKNLISNTEKDYKLIKDLQNNQKENSGEISTSDRTKNSSGSFLTQISSSKIKLNIMNLLNYNNSNNNKSELENKIQTSKSFDISFKEEGSFIPPKVPFSPKSASNCSSGKNYSMKKKIMSCEEIREEKSESEESIMAKYLYALEPKTQNLFCFNSLNKNITKIKIDFEKSKIPIKQFENYHSTLNFQDNFYLSGGCDSPKSFYKFNQKEKIFEKLPEMLSPHSYHGIIGSNNFIYVISGFKSKKVERYDIINKNWVSLDSLNSSFSWPSCLEIKNKYIYIFGGLCSSTTEQKNEKDTVLRLNIENLGNKWENISFVYKNNNNNDFKLPFYFGLLKLNNENILLFGGKFDLKNSNNNSFYKYELEGNVIEKCENLKLSKNEEFNGKVFYDLGNHLFGEFSSLMPGNFYLINTVNNNIESFCMEH